jgi:hypothetical protein
VLRPDKATPVAYVLQNNTQLGFFFFKKEDAEAIIAKVIQPRGLK